MNKSADYEKASMISCLNDAKHFVRVAASVKVYKNRYSDETFINSIDLAELYLQDAEVHYKRWVEIVNGAS